MRKQTKVLVAAALLTLGASFSAFAAKTGEWTLEDDGWYCLDKDGNPYEDEWCLSYGVEYYVGSDGLMVTSDWVDYEDNYYYVGSDGAKTVDAWRYLTPYDDEDADEEWYFFNSNGKMVTGKKVIDGKTYYFDSDGKMLTGWVEYDSENKVADEANDYSSKLTYCDETGARVTGWVETWEPGTDEEDQDEDDLNWYYIKSAGGVQTGKAKSINGSTYLFDNEGKMLTGWVLGSDSNADGKIDEFAKFDGDASKIAVDKAIYFCGNSDQGQVKKNRWIKTWMPKDYEDGDDDDDQYWYYLTKTGELFLPEVDEETTAYSVTFVDGDKAVFTTGTSNLGIGFKEISNKDYAFKADGRMWTGLASINGVRYYFGGSNDGVMVTGSVMIADEDGQEYKFYFGKNNKNGYTEGAAVTGAAEKYLYNNGLLVKAESDKFEVKEINELEYIVNASGAIQTGAKKYKEDGETLFSAEDCEFYTATSDGAKKGAVKTGDIEY